MQIGEIKRRAWQLVTEKFSNIFVLLLGPALLLFGAYILLLLPFVGTLAFYLLLFIGVFAIVGAYAPIAAGLQDHAAVDKTNFKTPFKIFSGKVWVSILVTFICLWVVNFGVSMITCLLLLLPIALFAVTESGLSIFLLFLMLLVAMVIMIVVDMGFQMTMFITLDVRHPLTGSQLPAELRQELQAQGDWALGWSSLRLSWKMMWGRMWKYIGLSLSLIGWDILCLFIFPLIFIFPYFTAISVNWYIQLTGDAAQRGVFDDVSHKASTTN